MKIEIYKIEDLKPFSDNPRNIDEYKFEATKQSILDFPDMMGVRYVIINKNKEILCGNMRYRACIDLGMKTIPAMMIDISQDKEKELIIKDNLSYGEWDWEALEIEWNTNIVDKWMGKQTIDYSALDYEDLTEQVDMMTSGVKHAIQIPIDMEHYEMAKELEKQCRERKIYIGGHLLRELQNIRKTYENN
jgi:hypothetical protein